VVLSGSVSLYADSYESEEQVLLCTLGRGQHVGELSLLFHNRTVSMAEVQEEVARTVAAQAELHGQKRKAGCSWLSAGTADISMGAAPVSE